MKKSILKFIQLITIILMLFGFGLSHLYSQAMYVREHNNIQTAYDLNSLQSITFPSGKMLIRNVNGSVAEFLLNELRYLSFESPNRVEEQLMLENNAGLLAFPNPVVDVLNVDLYRVVGNGTISMLTLDGKVMLIHPITDQGLVTISMENLPRGIYLCRYINGADVKTVKIIKQ